MADRFTQEEPGKWPVVDSYTLLFLIAYQLQFVFEPYEQQNNVVILVWWYLASKLV